MTADISRAISAVQLFSWKAEQKIIQSVQQGSGTQQKLTDPIEKFRKNYEVMMTTCLKLITEFMQIAFWKSFLVLMDLWSVSPFCHPRVISRSFGKKHFSIEKPRYQLGKLPKWKSLCYWETLPTLELYPNWETLSNWQFLPNCKNFLSREHFSTFISLLENTS